jgi:branched-chain amino acid transport system substrate-binding protein
MRTARHQAGAELRNLYQRQCRRRARLYRLRRLPAVAPIAEELKKMLVLMDCGTPRIFEDGKYNYVFRTAAHATMDNVGLVRYMKAKNVKMDSLSAINQDYAWGQDSRADFVAAAQQLYPNVKIQTDLLPKFGAGQYGTEISALVGAGPTWSIRACGRRPAGLRPAVGPRGCEA